LRRLLKSAATRKLGPPRKARVGRRNSEAAAATADSQQQNHDMSLGNVESRDDDIEQDHMWGPAIDNMPLIEYIWLRRSCGWLIT